MFDLAAGQGMGAFSTNEEIGLEPAGVLFPGLRKNAEGTVTGAMGSSSPCPMARTRFDRCYARGGQGLVDEPVVGELFHRPTAGPCTENWLSIRSESPTAGIWLWKDGGQRVWAGIALWPARRNALVLRLRIEKMEDANDNENLYCLPCVGLRLWCASSSRSFAQEEGDFQEGGIILASVKAPVSILDPEGIL